MNTYYVTTPIYYINDKPHIGHAYTTIAADILARYYRRKLGDQQVWFLVGTDEHGSKIERKAASQNKSSKEFSDEVSGLFRTAWEKLGISANDFIRTTEDRHERVVSAFVQQLYDKGWLYEKEYSGLYCVGHEAFLHAADLVDGLCPDHKAKPEAVTEKNWFFKTSAFLEPLQKKIESKELLIQPETRQNEVLGLLQLAQQKKVDLDFSLSRPNVAWGVSLPFDKNQTVYVWVDALLNYISALGWPDQKPFKEFWPANVQLIAKDILKFHAIYWPAMLLALDIPLPQALFIHGYFTVGGEKMSKSLGNAIDPLQIRKKYGNDALRYFLFREIPFGADGDFSEEKLQERYTADLANGLGNLVSRVTTMLEKYADGKFHTREDKVYQTIDDEIDDALREYRFHDALARIWSEIDAANLLIDEQEPWKLAKQGQTDQLKKLLDEVANRVVEIGILIAPFLPESSAKIEALLKQPVKKAEPMFPRQ